MRVWVLICHIHVSPETSEMVFLLKADDFKMIRLVKTLLDGYKTYASGSDHGDALLGPVDLGWR